MQGLVPILGLTVGLLAANQVLPWWLLPLALAGVVVLASSLAIVAALPRDLQITPIDLDPETDLASDVGSQVTALRSLGFEPLGKPLHLAMKPAAVAVPMVHRQLAIFANVYQVMLRKPRVFFDLVTVFDSGAILTSAPVVDAGAMPPRRDAFIQIKVGASPADLLAMHRGGVSLLASKGLRPKTTATTTLAELQTLLHDALLAQRAVFDAAPLRTACRAVWRSLTHRNPHLAPLGEQRDAVAQLQGTSTRTVPAV